MRKIHYAAQDFNVPDQAGLFVTLMAYTNNGQADARTYWINGLDVAADKVKTYTSYIMKEYSGVCAIMARVTNDDKGNRPFGLVATYESDRGTEPWRLAIYNAIGHFVSWRAYKSLLENVA